MQQDLQLILPQIMPQLKKIKNSCIKKCHKKEKLCQKRITTNIFIFYTQNHSSLKNIVNKNLLYFHNKKDFLTKEKYDLLPIQTTKLSHIPIFSIEIFKK